jgi:hypothetical protein
MAVIVLLVIVQRSQQASNSKIAKITFSNHHPGAPFLKI